jgi:chemotaxis protein CheZ
MSAKRASFTIEQNTPFASQAAPSVPVDIEGVGVRSVLAKLDELGAMIQPTQSVISNIADAYRREVIEVMKLRDEMEKIQTAITETKRQVVSLHTSATQAVKVNHAAGELGAVVLDTESATNKILAAAEKVEMLAGVIQSEVTLESKNQRAGEIAGVVMGIYEACNFQDLTGQRISRVCETLAFIENRVERMTEIWGGLDSLSSIMTEELNAFQEEHDALGTHALAMGPALAGSETHVGQDDIDALFR